MRLQPWNIDWITATIIAAVLVIIGAWAIIAIHQEWGILPTDLLAERR